MEPNTIIYLGGGIGITADPGKNSYDPPPLMTFSKQVEIPMIPPPKYKYYIYIMNY